MLKRAGSLSFVIVFLLALPAFGRWDKVLSTRDSIWIGRNLEIRSGHFFDENIGMVGAGSGTEIPLIFLTDDGGASWRPAITPINGNGVVSAFFFRDRNNGYATVHKTSFPASSIWRTSDGGLTWTDMTGSRIAFEHTCIYETSKALIVTAWDRTGGKGGFSTDGGATWQEVFANAADHLSNGIGFVDDLHGLVTMGPASLQPAGNNAYITSDGGLTWTTTREFNEAWSVYARKGTSTFFVAPEGDIAGSTGDRYIHRSDDFGATWQTPYQFPVGIQLVGHIDGMGKVLYVQTRIQSTVKGLFRSDDLGLTWKNISGPSNIEDSRFVVTGCAAEVVYAFDNNGNVWKTTDGGDGTLGAPSASRLTLSVDTLLLGSFYCSPVTADFSITNAACDSLMLDSLRISGDTFGEFALDTQAPLTLGTFGERTISVTFTPGASGSRKVVLHLKGRRGPFLFDTTITVVAKDRIAPELFIPQLASVKAGEELTVPIFIKPTTDTFSIGQYRIHLRFNGDILAPDHADLLATLSENGVVALSPDGEDGLLLVGTPLAPITESSDLAKPLVKVVMKTYLSRSLATTIEIDSFGIPQLIPRCPDVEMPLALFSIDPDCGDSLLAEFMRTQAIPRIVSIIPNPMRDIAEVTISLPERCRLQIDIANVQGEIVRTAMPAQLLAQGIHRKPISLSGLGHGVYYVCLTDERGRIAVKKIIELQ